jgi:hypothetical protein
MRKARSTAAKTPKKPADAQAGAVLVLKFAIKLFDRDEGEAANWKLIAETLFKAAFDAIDRSAALLRRVNAGSYDRLAVDPASGKTPALTGRDEAAKTDLKAPGPGAADAFRNSV